MNPFRVLSAVLAFVGIVFIVLSVWSLASADPFGIFIIIGVVCGLLGILSFVIAGLLWMAKNSPVSPLKNPSKEVFIGNLLAFSLIVGAFFRIVSLTTFPTDETFLLAVPIVGILIGAILLYRFKFWYSPRSSLLALLISIALGWVFQIFYLAAEFAVLFFVEK